MAELPCACRGNMSEVACVLVPESQASGPLVQNGADHQSTQTVETALVGRWARTSLILLSNNDVPRQQERRINY
jgi:hypothetical protein